MRKTAQIMQIVPFPRRFARKDGNGHPGNPSMPNSRKNRKTSGVSHGT
jgi:hypothetical protein